jgi:nucleotide-binding universal stress UspA family protein
MKTIIIGVDSSPGARAALRLAATVAEELDARLVAVHVLDQLVAGVGSAERFAEQILYDEIPDASVEVRGEVGDVAERLAAVAEAEQAALVVVGARSRGRSGTSLRTRRAAELAELTRIPVVVAPLQEVAPTQGRSGSPATPAPPEHRSGDRTHGRPAHRGGADDGARRLGRSSGSCIRNTKVLRQTL